MGHADKAQPPLIAELPPTAKVRQPPSPQVSDLERFIRPNDRTPGAAAQRRVRTTFYK